MAFARRTAGYPLPDRGSTPLLPAPGFSGRRPPLHGGKGLQIFGPGAQRDDSEWDLGRRRDGDGDARPSQAVQERAGGQRRLGDLGRADPVGYHRRFRCGSSTMMAGMASSRMAATPADHAAVRFNMSALLAGPATPPGCSRSAGGPLSSWVFYTLRDLFTSSSHRSVDSGKEGHGGSPDRPPELAQPVRRGLSVASSSGWWPVSQSVARRRPPSHLARP